MDAHAGVGVRLRQPARGVGQPGRPRAVAGASVAELRERDFSDISPSARSLGGLPGRPAAGRVPGHALDHPSERPPDLDHDHAHRHPAGGRPPGDPGRRARADGREPVGHAAPGSRGAQPHERADLDPPPGRRGADAQPSRGRRLRGDRRQRRLRSPGRRRRARRSTRPIWTTSSPSRAAYRSAPSRACAGTAYRPSACAIRSADRT